MAFRLTKKHWALASLWLWAGSLLLPAIIFYGGSQQTGDVFYGGMVLLWGWNAVWMLLSFAWLANVAFLIAVRHLLYWWPKEAVAWAVAACLLSLDSLRLAHAPLYDSGEADVFGFGLGAMLWFMSLCVLWIGAALELRAERQLAGRPLLTASWQWRVAIAFLILGLGGSIAKALFDRFNANPREHEHMSHTAFKRGSICAASNPRPLREPFELTGPLQVESTIHSPMGRIFWNSPIDLLGWGVPAVRVGTTDFRLVGDSDYPIVLAEAARGAPAATLTAFERIDGAHPGIGASMTAFGSSTPIATFFWSTSGSMHNHLCPELVDFFEDAKRPIAESIAHLRLPKEALTYSFEFGKLSAGEAKWELAPVAGSLPSGSDCPTSIAIENSQPYLNDIRSIFSTLNGQLVLINTGLRYIYPTGSRGHPAIACSNGAVYVLDRLRFFSSAEKSFEVVRVLKLDFPEPKVVWQRGAVLPESLETYVPIAADERNGTVRVALSKLGADNVAEPERLLFELLPKTDGSAKN